MAAEVEESVRAALLSMSAVTALLNVSGTAANLVVLSMIPQGLTPPAEGVVMIDIDRGDHLNDLGGTSGACMYDITVTARARIPENCRLLADAIRLNGTTPGTGLHGYTGTPSDVLIDAWMVDENGPIFLREADGSDNGWWDLDMNFTVFQAEAR